MTDRSICWCASVLVATLLLAGCERKPAPAKPASPATPAPAAKPATPAAEATPASPGATATSQPAQPPGVAGQPGQPGLPAGHPPIPATQTPAKAAPTSPAMPTNPAMPANPAMPVNRAAAPPQKITAADGPRNWQGRGVSWTIPPGWEQTMGSGMRFATLKPADTPGAAEVAVSHFPGDVGGMLNNVNRWRRQIGLQPITEAQLPEQTRPIRIGDIDATVVDVGGDAPDKPQCVVLSVPHAGRTWFFKMVGNGDVVKGQRGAFMAFGESVRFNTLPAGHP